MEKLRYKIRRLFVENVKRVRIVEVIPKGNIVEIAGQNAQGKSSVLDSIIYVLGGKEVIPKEPVRKGEKTARIILETDDFTATRSWTADNKTYLTVAANTGKSPQAFLDSKISRISFDPVEFMRMKPKEQEALLRQITGLDTTDLETQKAEIYQTRHSIGREVERLKVFRKELGEPTYDLPNEEQSVQELIDKIDSIGKTTEARNKLVSKIATMRGDASNANERIKIKLEQIHSLEKEIQDIENVKIVNAGRIESMQVELDGMVLEDAVPLRGDLMTIEERNKLIRQNQSINKVQNEWDDKQKEYSGYTEELSELDVEIQNRILNTEFPIEGLSVEEERGITFNGIILSEASQAEQIKIGLAIAEQLNPELQIVIIKDGSLLDKKSTKAIIDFAKKKDCQVWIERVEPTSADAIVIEDGGVVGK